MSARRAPPPPTATRATWTTAALEALAESGLTAVAVEPLARRLGVTKGSFYWHFENRDELVEATLLAWEATSTEAVIARLSKMTSPARRLHALLDTAHAGTTSGRVELALSAAWDDPRVKPVLRRVTDRRVSYLTECYEALGHADPRRAAMLAMSSYLGLAELTRLGVMTTAERAAHAVYLSKVLSAAG